ncbi:hypothetical protein [Bacterioplanoides sp.]|uniref:hypothetical protein n=1 Tax=Bacterioplanoides sp. TaxID=2066072 RepID=UPI003AFF6141
MEFNPARTIKITALLLLLAVITQVGYTVMYVAEMNPPKQFFWGLETLLFTILSAFATAAMVQAKRFQLGWAAIAASAVLNVVQVSIGLTLFIPFREAAAQTETLQPLARAIVALSFVIYYAAKLLLGMAAVVFGMNSMKDGNKALGGLTALLGALALVANAILITFGRDGFLPSPVAGASGVVATLLLAFCLMSLAREEK